MGIGKIVTALAIPSVMAIPETGKIAQASKQGKTAKQVLNSIVNIGKYFAIPAAMTIIPGGIAATALFTVAGNFILPSLIPDLDVNKDSNQSLSRLA